MSSLMKPVTLAAVAVALIPPMPASSQVIARAAVIGSWRTRWAWNVVWTHATGVVPLMAESSVTLKADGTFMSDYTTVVDEAGTTGRSMPWGKGAWTLAGDTLVVESPPIRRAEAYSRVVATR